MTVVGLHPEDLFDKLLDGELTAPERERLRQHLDVCEVCHFEYAARGDFQAEAVELAGLGGPPALPLRPVLNVEPAAPVVAGVAPRRRRWAVWALAAAALITASGAVASGLVGRAPWHALGAMFVASKSPSAAGEGAETPLVKRGHGAGSPVASVATPAEPAPATEVPTAAAAELPLAASSPRVGQTAPSRSREASRYAASGPTVLAVAASKADVVPAAPSKELPAPAPAKESAAKLFGDANQARRSGDVGRASGLYHLLQDQYPGSPEAELSRVTLSLLLLDSGDARGALSGFERYLAGSSRGLEAEALVGRARALGRLGRSDQEAAAWREVQRKYPRSIYGRQATERLLALGQP